MKNILVVNVNWLGDVIFSSPVFRALRQTYPDAKLTCLAVPRVMEILECIPDIDETIVYDENGKDRGLLAKLRVVGKIKRCKFDSVFLLSRSFSRASMMALAKIPIRVGYENKNRGRLLTHIAQANPTEIHRSDYYLGVVEKFGVKVSDRSTELIVDEVDDLYVKKLLSEQGYDPKQYTVALNPGGNWDLKRWPHQNFSKLVQLLKNDGSIRVLFTGSKQDVPLVEKICVDYQGCHNPIIMTGKVSLKQLVALMRNVNLFITADSGPLHIATSVGCRSISLFGPTRPELTGPRGEGVSEILQKDVGCNRAACYFLECQNNTCMQAISAGEVYETIKRIQNS